MNKTTQSKMENALNKLYARVRELELTDYEKQLCNVKGFLYACSRKNIMQVTAFLTALMVQHGRNLEEIESLLEGDF